jgi:23S rRNA (uracil1939-C5)-methyltransferase
VVERLLIERIGHRGDGIAQGHDGPVFVPGTLPGETAEVEAVPGHPDRRRLISIVEASSARISPICPHFGICGGCALQHWEHAAYRAWKRNLVAAALHQAGITAPVGELVDAHGEGRRRVVFHARRGSHNVLEVGFAAARSHHVISIDRCPVLVSGLDGALSATWAIAEALLPARKPLDIQVTATDTGLDVDVRGSGALAAPLVTELARLTASHRLARLTRHGELIAMAQQPTLRVGKAIVALPPATFLQATAAGEATLARLVLASCAGARNVADLFAGIGPFALRVAETSRITAVDVEEAALAALRRAATSTPGLKPVAVERRDLFRNPLLRAELSGFDAVVFDPPRQGAQAQAREIATSGVPIVVAVSCNAATLARDLRILCDNGYQLTAVTPVDQFRYSAHVEVVARLEKQTEAHSSKRLLATTE